MFFSLDVLAICNTPLSRTNILAGQIPTSAKYNADFNNLYSKVNDLPGDCFLDSSITTNQIADNAVTTDKIANNSLIPANFAAGVIPSYARPLRIRAFTSSSTWVKQPDVGSIVVHVVGGGGAAKHNMPSQGFVSAEASSFGTFCTANGGGVSNDGSGGIGGSASGGDINLSGSNGDIQTATRGPSVYGAYDWIAYGGNGGVSYFGKYGQGGSYRQHQFGNSAFTGSGGGGAGGVCIKRIVGSLLPDSVSVTVGSGGYVAGSTASVSNPGQSGLVIIYEYE